MKSTQHVTGFTQYTIYNTQYYNNQVFEHRVQVFRFFFLSVIFTLCALSFTLPCQAKEMTILYTGQSHAMIYPCNCPIEPDGGIARRLTLIKELRKENPDCLLLDTGNFFAAGLMDEYTQNAQFDIKRTLVNLKAMELMKYDAVAVSDDEFNFGREFFEENTEKISLPFLSCNLRTAKALPYIIKDAAGLKIGILGVTTPVAKAKSEGIEIIEPSKAVTEAVQNLKKAGAQIIIVLSNLSEAEDFNLINEAPGIDILIQGARSAKNDLFQKIGNTLVLKTSWQARRLGKASFKIEEGRITEHRVEGLRLSDKVLDDPRILSVLPRCFSDAHCKKEGYIGICREPGSLGSGCIFNRANQVKLTVITSKSCSACNTEPVIDFLKKQFAGLSVTYLYYPQKQAKKMVRDFSISGLPAYLLDQAVEKEVGFNSLSPNLEKKANFYLIKPHFSGVSYYLNRQKIKGKLDLFISLYDKDTPALLEAIKEFNPDMHFLAVEEERGFGASGGRFEVEEYLRSVCVRKYYPQYFWDYISCRAKNKDSSWWQDCAVSLDENKIKICARGGEAESLLKENISLNKELGVMFGPTYLLDNQEIFSTKGAPTKEALKQIIKR